MRKLLIVFCLFMCLFGFSASAQYTTKANGSYESAATWMCNCVPPEGPITDIVINHNVTMSNKHEIHNLTVNSGKTFTQNDTIWLVGDLTNLGIFYTTKTIAFGRRNGNANTVHQTVTTNSMQGQFGNLAVGATARFSSLTFNNTATPIAITFNLGNGTDVNGMVLVSGNVAFTNGVIDIGSDNHMIFNLGATATRTNGFLIRGNAPGGGGQMRVFYPSGASSFTYHIADNVFPYEYSPVTVNFSANSFPNREVSISVIDAAHPNLNVLCQSASDYISRYWRVSGTRLETYTMSSMSFRYSPVDIVGNPANFKFYFWDGTNWQIRTPFTLGTNVITLLNLDETTLTNNNTAIACEVTAMN